MKPRKIIGAAAALAAAASIGSCGIFEAPSNEVPTVYGPPEWFETETASQTTSDGSSEPPVSTETSEADETFKPETNEPEVVYGPPEWFETEASETEDTFDPKYNEPIAVYGPPAWFEDNETTEETTVDPDTIPEEETDITTENDNPKNLDDIIEDFFGGIFKPEENEPVDVYGPPEWFE